MTTVLEAATAAGDDHVIEQRDTDDVGGRGGGWCSMLELGLLNTKENPDERTEHPTPRQRAAESQ